MKISQNGVDLIKRFEGLELEAYQDVAGIWTIGYGHTGPDVTPGMRITEQEAEDLLKKDLKPREDAVGRLVKVPLNQNEFDALVSFVYNVGEANFKKSTARSRLNSGDRAGAAEALTWFNKATIGGVLREVAGLTRRRAAERALFLEPVNPPIVNDAEQIAENSRVTPVEDAPRRGNLAESRTIQGATVAGAAGVAASTVGRNSAEKLTKMETEVEQGKGLTIEPSGGETIATTGTAAPSSGEEAATTGTTAPSGGEEAAATAPSSGPGETTTTSTETTVLTPSKSEKNIADSQIQLAMMILILLAVLYIIFARIDDWWRYRR